ncbi:hypothetical protein PV08_06402 [Exophiala spinifera]|uniref:Glyoxal oxidase N-terminal domain-containing protein n=1 Tax=Exophiala spinifera TaxID=91928 RepID=A0A0D1YMS7_9EURO|nr:uncharacterized protein PV08_06402 [Exophiala spinifera]KIW16351.1 hypothetical protein PV08_06402 [Exophiala spinifera]
MNLLTIQYLFFYLAPIASAPLYDQDVSLDYDYFKLAGSSGVPAMHAAVLPPHGKVVFLDKVENYTELLLPNNRYAYSSLYDPISHELYPLSVATNPFCCGGTFLPDGRLVTLGGNGPLLWLDPTVSDGFDAIRFLGSSNAAYHWTEPGNKLASKRWYASAQTMSNGDIFVAAGSLNGLSPANHSNNNPTYEILGANSVSKGKSMPMDILVKTQPY